MKIPIIILMLFFAASDSFSQKNKSKSAFTNVYHNQNNISVRNFDGTRSTIYLGGRSATLFNPDGTQSSINASSLVAFDGTQSTVNFNRFSTTVYNSDGTQFVIVHKQHSSTLSTADGTHNINHFFFKEGERPWRYVVDVLVHTNWILQKRQLLSLEEGASEPESEPQN